jgi:DNA repair exonuclease SbcCD ATPase subunit
MSWNRNVLTTGALVLALAAAGACNREPAPEVGEGAAADVDRTAELQRERSEEIADLQERVAELERDYAEERQEVVRGEAAATAGLREELKEDMTNVRQAVNDLHTTTAENWWERHEQALQQSLDDVEADVKRLAGNLPPAKPQPTATTGESPSAEPFTSRRDEMVAELRARVEAMEQALDNVKASGARETEVEDTRARVAKLGEDLDRLGSASPDDWWDISRTRVVDYIDRVENSVDRLDDNEPRTSAQ